MSIWSNKREDPPAPRPATAPPTPQPTAREFSAPEIRKEQVPVSPTPYRTSEAETKNHIGKAVKVVGQIFAKEDLYVDGAVEGTIEAHEHKVTIGPNGTVKAGLKAREVVVLGQVQGNVEATDKVDLRKDAKLMGDIATARISIEDGAIFKGSIDIKRADPKPAPAATPAAPAPAAPASTSSSGPAASASSSGPAASAAAAGAPSGAKR